jgi:hypothetical protein
MSASIIVRIDWNEHNWEKPSDNYQIGDTYAVEFDEDGYIL